MPSIHKRYDKPDFSTQIEGSLLVSLGETHWRLCIELNMRTKRL